MDHAEAEAQQLGAVLFDDNHQPVFDQKSLDILHEWKNLKDEGIVPESVFTMGAGTRAAVTRPYH